MTPDVIESMIGLLMAIATICAVLLIFSGLFWAVIHTFFGE